MSNTLPPLRIIPKTCIVSPSADWSRRRFLAAIGAGVAVGKLSALAEAPDAPAPAPSINVMAGRPTGRSVVLNLFANQPGPWRLEWGTDLGVPARRTLDFDIDAALPRELLLDDLTPATRYSYRILKLNDPASHPAIDGTFCTARPPGQSFTFTLTADSHLPVELRPADSPFGRAVRQASAISPDFHVMLGDEAMTHHARYLATAQDDADRVYRSMRANYQPLARVAPVFFALGNHEGEGWIDEGYGLSRKLAESSRAARLKYIPNPSGDTYSSGGSTGQNFFAWEWGDALLIVLDPYTYSTTKPQRPEDWTLGDEQLRWFERVLAASSRRWKLVFQHQLLGGSDYAQPYGKIGPYLFYGRGGASHAHVGEQARIGELMRKHGGSVIFKGHDHIWADEVRDGIRYTTCGRLSGSRPNLPRWGDDPKFQALYPNGFLGGWGFLRVDVSPGSLRVRYVGIGGETLGEYSVG